jgi:hypothetical protein
MNQYLLAQTYVEMGLLPQALQAFERAVTMMLDEEELHRAESALKEGLAIAPGNPGLRALRDRLREMRDAREPSDSGEAEEAGDQQNFIEWLRDVDGQLGMTLPESAIAAASPPPAPPPKGGITAAEEEALRPSTETTDVSPEDRRVALCLNDMKAMTPEQLEHLRQQLISMFTDVRKTYEEGLLSDWEMRTIKEFYKAFCMAVDQHRRVAK